MECEYCSKARILFNGAVFCSRNEKHIEKPASGLFYFPPIQLESNEHVSRLSLRFVFNGEQQYRIGRRIISIDDDSYTVINHKQTYKVIHPGGSMLLGLAYNPSHANDILNNLIADDNKL